MHDNLSIAVYAKLMYKLTSLSVDEIFLPRFLNWSTSFRGLSSFNRGCRYNLTLNTLGPNRICPKILRKKFYIWLMYFIFSNLIDAFLMRWLTSYSIDEMLLPSYMNSYCCIFQQKNVSLKKNITLRPLNRHKVLK